jgi:hypothetical protein
VDDDKSFTKTSPSPAVYLFILAFLYFALDLDCVYRAFETKVSSFESALIYSHAVIG